MNELRSYYIEQAASQPEPCLILHPLKKLKPRRLTLRNIGLIAAGMVLMLTIVTVSVPSVRAAMETIISVVTGQKQITVYNPITGEIEENTVAAFSESASDILRGYAGDTEGTFTICGENDNLGGMSQTRGVGYTDPDAFWAELDGSGLPVMSDWESLTDFSGHINYRIGEQINQWLEGGYVIKEYGFDTSMVTSWSFSAKTASTNVSYTVRGGYGNDTDPFTGWDIKPVSVDGWESALYYSDNGYSHILRLFKRLPEPVAVPLDGGGSWQCTHMVCDVYSDILNLDKLTDIAEQID